MISITPPGVDGVASLSTVWAVMEAARAGAGDATAAARGFLPKAGEMLSNGLHATGFAIGYAATFPAVLVSRLVPADNAFVYGLADGGRAGFDMARSTLGASAAPGSSVSELPKLVTADA